MTRLMEQAIEKLKSVPEAEQDQFAKFLLNELKEDERWANSTAAHESKLKAFIDQVVADDDAGKCEPLDPDLL